MSYILVASTRVLLTDWVRIWTVSLSKQFDAKQCLCTGLAVIVLRSV